MRKTLTDNKIKSLSASSNRKSIPDPECRGHYIRVSPAGAKTFYAVARDPHGKQVWARIGSADHYKIDDARDACRAVIKRIKAGLPAFDAPPPKPDTFKTVAEDWLKRHVGAKMLRTKDEIERTLRVYIYPSWGARGFTGITRSDVTKLLDRVEDENGPRMADLVLALVRKLCNWYAARHADYMSPIVRGMNRYDSAGRRRKRILNDDELRLIWRQAEASGTYGAILRLCLLTAQRKDKVAGMRWQDVSDDGTWTVPAEDREKSTGGVLLLPQKAVAIIRAQPKLGENPHVFAGTADSYFSGWSKCKRVMDINLLNAARESSAQAGGDPAKVEPFPRWTIHDLRRTARSLMSRAGVRSDFAERVLGHAIAGVEGVYDRYHFATEKAQALAALAMLIEQIVTGDRGA